MRLYFLSLLLFILSTCSSNQSIPYVDSELNVVDLDKEPVGKTSPVIHNESAEHLGVGPSLPLSVVAKNKSKTNKTVWGLVLSPGLNRVICHAVAVRSLYEKGIQFNVFTGSGMGAVVAAYLAEGVTTEVIEWKFHKFFQKSKDLKPFSTEWIEQVKSSLLKDFLGKKIQNTKLTLLIPSYNNEERKIEFARRGDLHVKLLENLTLSKSVKGKYTSPLERGVLDTLKIRKFGVQKIVSINALGKKISFSKNEDYLFGLYAKLSTNYLSNDEKTFDFQLNLPLENFSLDSVENLPEYLRASYLYLRDNSADIKSDYLSERKN